MSPRPLFGHLPLEVLNYAQNLERADRPLADVLAQAYRLGPQVTRRLEIEHPGPAMVRCPVPLPTSYVADNLEERDRTMMAGLLALRVLDRHAPQKEATPGSDLGDVLAKFRGDV